MEGGKYGRKEKLHHHSFYERAAYSIVLVLAVLVIGTLGMHFIEGYPYVDSFYFVSMLATGEGPTVTPVTSLGKIFASAIAFVSIGTVVFALAFLFGPFFARMMKIEEKRLEKEEEAVEKRIKKI